MQGPTSTAITICNNKYLAKYYYNDGSFIFDIDPTQPDEVTIAKVPRYPFQLKPGFGVMSIWQKTIFNEEELRAYLKFTRESNLIDFQLKVSNYQLERMDKSALPPGMTRPPLFMGEEFLEGEWNELCYLGWVNGDGS